LVKIIFDQARPRRWRVSSSSPNCEMRRACERARSDAQRVAERALDLAAARHALHVDEVDDDDAAQVAQADLARDLGHRVEVGLERDVLEVEAVAARACPS
jgi:hypothetical protein